MDADDVRRLVGKVADGFGADRAERQQRTALVAADFDALREAGLQLTGLPVERGGLWSSLGASTRPICEIYRTLAGGDPSVALVASMHPAVLAFWLATPTVDDEPPGVAAAWAAQRASVFETVEAGAWWGTITSEPGSGGDVRRSKATAVRAGAAAGEQDSGGWLVSGQKHFGSGTGISSFMLTTAVAEGDELADWFYVPMPEGQRADGTAGNPLDGSAGITLAAPWDGHGMQATQSHALTFDSCPAVRCAWPGHLDDLIAGAAPFFGALFTGVVLGVVETAVATARAQLMAKGGASSLRPYEQVEWAQAELEAWTAEQAYEGALRTIETTPALARGASLRAKTVVAQLAESCLLRLTRVLGGGTFSRRSPFGNWFEDVRALGFLRPPWGLAYDGLVADSLATPVAGSTSST